MAEDRYADDGILHYNSEAQTLWTRQPLRERRLFKHSELSLEQLAGLLALPVRGWMAYCCRFRGSEFQPFADYIDCSIVRLAMRKFKRLRGHKQRALAWLHRLKRKSPGLFVPWCGRESFTVGTTKVR